MLGLLIWMAAIQDPAIEIRPGELTLEVGQSAQLEAVVTGASDSGVVFFSGNRIALTVTPAGLVRANRAGEFTVTALLPDKPFDGNWDYYSRRDPGLRASITVRVPEPPLATIEIAGFPKEMYVGTTLPIAVRGEDASGSRRTDLSPRFEVSDPALAETDGFGHVTALAEGSFTITARAGRVMASTLST